MESIGSNFKEKLIEHSLMLGGLVLYYLYLRPKDLLQTRSKGKAELPEKAKSEEKAVSSG